MRVSGLYIYPIKGCRGVAVDEATVEAWGLTGDRRWMIVDETGRFIGQRERPELARVTARLVDGGVEAYVDGMEPLAVKEPRPSALVPVRVWSGELQAVEAAEEAHEWFSEYLSARVRLVWLDDPYRRPPDEEYGVRSAFTDAFPLLLTTEASLDALNDWLVEAGEEPVPMNRFRPNVVIAGSEPWAEDAWVSLRFSDGPELRCAKPCKRCVVTTTDQWTGERRGREPLRTLARRRRFGPEAPAGRGDEDGTSDGEASGGVTRTDGTAPRGGAPARRASGVRAFGGLARTDGAGAVFGMNLAPVDAGGAGVCGTLSVGATVEPVARTS